MNRYAAYVRTSIDEPGSFSVDAQIRAITEWVHAHGGDLVEIYADEGHSGRTIHRPAFQQMRRDAREALFDALVVHRFDRFARSRTDSMALKTLLRVDYGVKVLSVTEQSEDSDGALGVFIEGMMESIAEWYSRNLGSELAKARREKWEQGYHNNKPPFGLRRDGKLLVADEDELPALLMAFKMYGTGKHSYEDIAHTLNQKGYRTKAGKPFKWTAVRVILINPIYIGKVRYRETQWRADGSRDFTGKIEWRDGQHAPVIDPELFEKCQRIRSERIAKIEKGGRYRTYLLTGLIHCYRCYKNPPQYAREFATSGTMFGTTRQNRHARYFCTNRVDGFECAQKPVLCSAIDIQVERILKQFEMPAEWKAKLAQYIGGVLEAQAAHERIEQIRAAIEQMDFRWDNGFIADRTEYIEKRMQLQAELERCAPAPQHDDIGLDLLENFATHWERCAGNLHLQHQLVKLIVEKVYVKGERVMGIALNCGFYINCMGG